MTQKRPIALVTGGARGIGRAISLRLAQDYTVAFTYKASLPDEGLAECLAIKADLLEDDTPERVIRTVMERFGRLDVLVNNAGALRASPVDTFDREACRENMELNVNAPHALLAAALPHLEEGAAVVNISSVNAELPPKGAVMYGASKAALNLWTKGVAKELGPRSIRVNAVAPGPVNINEAPRDAALTQAFLELTALDRLATAEDIADAVRFLAGSAARSITGEVLTVSGGYRL